MAMLLALAEGQLLEFGVAVGVFPFKNQTENGSLNSGWNKQGTAHWESQYLDTIYTFKIRKANNIILLQNEKAQRKGRQD